MAAMHVWDVYQELRERNTSSLSEEQRWLAAVCDLRQEVNAGGFDSYFRFWGGNSAPAALHALPALLGQDWADVLQEGMAIIGDPYPANADDRARLLGDDTDEKLEELDRRFLELEGSNDADGRLDALIAANPNLRVHGPDDGQ